MRLTFSHGLLLATIGCCLLPASTLAASPASKQKSALSGGVAYLESQQQADGSFNGFGSEWALSALASTKVAPAGVRETSGSTDARSWYRSLVGDPATWPEGSEPPVTDYETAALAAYAAGIEPARVSQTQNLIAQIAADYQDASPGYYGEPAVFDGTVFGLLALADAKTRSGQQRVPQVLLEQSVQVLRNNQHTDGGWTYVKAEGSKAVLQAPAEAELTGAAMAALCGAGVANSNSTIVKAESYLKADLAAETSGNGAFATEFGPNTDSNAWALEGLNACGISATGPEFTTSTGNTPSDFLLSQQLPDGGFRSEPSDATPNLYSTQDAVRALAGAGFTVAPVKPKEAPKWVYERSFSTSPSSPGLLTLIVNNGTPNLAVCAVKIAPEAAKTTLARVLEVAQTASTPAKCVTGLAPASGKGPITQISGAPSTPKATWLISIDGNTEKQATRKTGIEIGDTIYLRFA